MRLSPFLDGFAAAVRGAPPPGAAWLAPLLAQPGFAVYRNTVLGGCIDALEANHPVVAALTGRDWFRAAAADYARRHPPTDTRLLAYGQGFADFIAGPAGAVGLPWLPAVARLERLWRASHTAADAPALTAAHLQALPPGALPRLCLAPHPAARWRWFEDAPALTLWQAHQLGNAQQRTAALQAIDWRGEGALLTRPGGQVLLAPAGRGTCAFLDACAAGAALADALASAAAIEGDAFDAGALLGQLLEAGALRAID